MFKLFVLLMVTSVFGSRPHCDRNSVLQYLKVPTYDFSVILLDKVAQETDGHFVFSPISTWLQLLALADGAHGKTLNEILNVTRYNTVCSRKKVRKAFNFLDRELSGIIKRQSIFVIDELLNVKDSFVNNVETLNAAKVLQANFRNRTKSVDKVNEVIDSATNGTFTELFNHNDFQMTVLLMTDIATMKTNWKSPFNPVYTKLERFYSHDPVLTGYVHMMNQIGVFNFNNIPEINAQALELPFSEKASMIFLLPNIDMAENLFLSMNDIRMASILRQLKSNRPRLINLKVPRFSLTTDIENMPELLYDMGVKNLFSPRYAEFKNISDYRVYVSMMLNNVGIEVTEKGVSANIAPEAVVKGEDPLDVSFNRPFAFLLVDKTANVILFAGIYSKPSLF